MFAQQVLDHINLKRTRKQLSAQLHIDDKSSNGMLEFDITMDFYMF